MDNETLNMIIKTVVACVSVILTTFVIPWIKGKVNADKLAKIEEYTVLAVRCAEQIYTPEEWREKKDYVVAYVAKKAIKIGLYLTAEDINNLIEGIVNEVKKG